MNKSKYRLLSYSLSEKTPMYGRLKPVRVKSDRQLKNGDSCNTSVVTFSNHSGTHVDAPKHFFNSGKSVNDYNINELVFDAPLLMDCPKEKDQLILPEDLRITKKCDLLLIRTGFFRHRRNNKYRTNNPGISREAAIYIRQRHSYIRAIGVDVISISAYQNRKEGREAHSFFLKSQGFPGQPIILIEDMDLRGDLRKLRRVFIVPLFFEKVDSMPCTIIGEF